MVTQASTLIEGEGRGSNALIDSNIELKGEELEQLKVLRKEYGTQKRSIPKDLVSFRWELKGLLESEGDRSYQFTDLGKIPVGALALALFNQVQEPLLLSELVKLEGSVGIAETAGLSCLEERRADLLIYRAQLRRILVNSLYFLEVKANGNIFYSNRKSFINRSRVRASSSFMRMLAQNHQICVAWESQNFAPVW